MNDRQIQTENAKAAWKLYSMRLCITMCKYFVVPASLSSNLVEEDIGQLLKFR